MGVVRLFYRNVNASTRIPRIIINTSVNAGINTINPFTLLRMKGTNPSLTITGQGNKGAMAQLNLSASDTTTSLPNCSLIATDTGFFGATFQMEVSPHLPVPGWQSAPELDFLKKSRKYWFFWSNISN